MKTYDEIDIAARNMAKKYDDNLLERMRVVAKIQSISDGDASALYAEMFMLETIGSALFSALATMRWVQGKTDLYSGYIDELIASGSGSYLHRADVIL